MGKLSIFRILLATILLFGTINLWAQEKVHYLPFQETVKRMPKGERDFFKEDPYFSISQIKVTEYEDDCPADYFEGSRRKSNFFEFPNFIPFSTSSSSQLNEELGSVIVTVDKLVALGTKVWDIVKKGKPVVQVERKNPISVLPLIRDYPEDDLRATFFRMDNWSHPKATRYKIEYQNIYGLTVVSLSYTIHFQYNGSYEGKGRYLTGLDITPSEVAVSWGFEFNVSTKLIGISNQGTTEDPLASATLEISHNVSSPFKEIRAVKTFHVSGDGKLVSF